MSDTMYVFATDCLPLLPWMARKVLRLIGEQDGLVGVIPYYPKGTVVCFDTENNAKGARNILRLNGMNVGTNICEVIVDGDDFYCKDC